MTVIKETIIYKKITSRIYDDGKPLCRHKVEEEEVDAIEIPENATNGDMIKAMFPNIQWDNECNGVFYGYKTNDRMMPMLGADFNWWNALYKKEVEE